MQLLTRQEAAARLRISVACLDRLVAAGKIKRVTIGTGTRPRVLFRDVDLDEFINDSVA